MSHIVLGSIAGIGLAVSQRLPISNPSESGSLLILGLVLFAAATYARRRLSRHAES
jgi:hypothetical protein